MKTGLPTWQDRLREMFRLGEDDYGEPCILLVDNDFESDVFPILELFIKGVIDRAVASEREALLKELMDEVGRMKSEEVSDSEAFLNAGLRKYLDKPITERTVLKIVEVFGKSIKPSIRNQSISEVQELLKSKLEELTD